MTIEETIYALLKVNPGLVPLIGDRIYPVDFPQRAAFPLIVYTRISSPMVLSHNLGASMSYPRFQFSVWAATYAGANGVADKLLEALNGVILGTGSASIPVDIRESRDGETELYRIDLDCQISHRI